MKAFSKRAVSIILVLAMAMGLTSCKSGKKSKKDISTCTKVEEQIGTLKNTEGNVWVNEDAKYEGMVNLLLYHVRQKNFRGSLIVATDDEVIFASGSRLLDIEGKEVTPYTIYEIGSISKAFVSMCILKLVEEGKMSVDDELGKYFPEYSSCTNFEKTSKVTVTQLLHMRSGIPDDINSPDQFWGLDIEDSWFAPDLKQNSKAQGDVVRSFYENVDDDRFIRQAFSVELLFEPGTELSYSNSNYWLLALIVEKVTGKAYSDYVNEVIFAPCNMMSSSSLMSGDVTASMPEEAWSFIPASTKGSGDIHSSVVDLLKFDRALFGGYLLDEKSMEILLDPIDMYACGWEVFLGRCSHSGATPGFHTCHIIYEKNGKHLYAIMFANNGENRLERYVYDQLQSSFEKVVAGEGKK
ncbi:MAG: beta-lactamase family protein [Clostridiales bacterium]|nr:beta-lactamase family protein [Clostridiales bacterium]